MGLFSDFFQKTEDKYESLLGKFSYHEQTSESNLHNTHPHVRPIFERHQIDLKNIRRRGTKMAAAAAVLGAFLAFPFLLGHPEQNTPTIGGAGSEVTKQHNPNDPSFSNNNQTEAEGGGQRHVSPPNTSVDDNEKGHQGHIHGRSYMAPPKEHGFHDLGLHQGQEKNSQVPDTGAHPSNLDVHKGGDS